MAPEASGVSRVLAAADADVAPTMAVCGLPHVRNVPRRPGTRARAPVTSAT